jgi:acetyl esterase/lipase
VTDLDPQIAQALERTAAGGWLPLTGGTVEQARAQYRGLSLVRRGDGYMPPQVARVTERSFDGPAGPIGVRVYEPEDAIAAIVVYLHGGGWVIGDLDTHDPICRDLARGTRAIVASVDYRLAPEAPHPAPLDDAMAALRWAAEGWPGHRLAVAGDSAGGGLAAGCALRARDEPDAPRVVAQLLLYPGVDPTMGEPSVAENAEGYFLTRSDMEWFTAHYLPQPEMRDDPTVNLLAAPDLHGLPPAVIAVAQYDPLRDEGRRYGDRLREAGVPVQVIEGPGLVHGYVGMTELSAAAAGTAAEVRAAFAALLG